MNKVALITGASRGIGRQTAITLAQAGINIVVNYANNEDRANEVVELCENEGVEAIAVKANVAIFEECKSMFDEAIEKLGSVDILINNAGITRDGLVMRMKEHDFMDVINTNLLGTFNCCKIASKLMMKKRSGKIVNLSSVVGVIGNAGQVNYSASKAGVIGLTKSLAKELSSRNINVNAVAPGFVETDMTDVLNDEQKTALMKQIPLKSLGKTEDIANCIKFLVSDDSRYITGQVINVDGGMVM